jgi:hypothetical protein
MASIASRGSARYASLGLFVRHVEVNQLRAIDPRCFDLPNSVFVVNAARYANEPPASVTAPFASEAQLTRFGEHMRRIRRALTRTIEMHCDHVHDHDDRCSAQLRCEAEMRHAGMMSATA